MEIITKEQISFLNYNNYKLRSWCPGHFLDEKKLTKDGASQIISAIKDVQDQETKTLQAKTRLREVIIQMQI